MKILTLMGLLLGGISTSFAQQNPQLYTIPTPFERYSHYQIILRGGAAIPTGAFATNYIDKTSLENYSLAVDWIFQKPFSLGLEVGRTYFSKRLPRDTYTTQEGDISAVQTRTISQIPIQGVVNLYMGKANAPIRPYIQLAAGASLIDYTLYYGTLASQQQSVKFTYGIGAGSKFLFKKDGSVGADIRVKYNQTPFSFDYIDKGVGQLNATVGLFYRWW